MIRVFIADDQAMVREGFGALLAAQPDMEIAGTAADGFAAVKEVERLHAAGAPPHVVLMDIRMPEMDGVEATRRILETYADLTRVLILTTFDLDEYVYSALRAGASGFLLKDAPAADLVNAVRVIHAGDGLLAPSVTRRLIADFARTRQGPLPGTPAALDTLTQREVEVFRLIASGQSNAEIAASLSVAEQTVKTHVGRILGKLQLRDRTQAVVLAYESGLVQPRISP
ncbi:response regulator transcription factor [Fodinicola acaciae]|uniref:response regulator n=1 Tax=Fodinicola acaciae TaxID=2681555 RepID=UPI0013CF995A